MKNLRIDGIEKFRNKGKKVMDMYGGFGDETCGMFTIPSPADNKNLIVIASSEGGWDHVSISKRKRTPNWREMAFIKDLFFEDEETVIQFHVPKSQHINVHQFCLHLWRSQTHEISLPPSEMVA